MSGLRLGAALAALVVCVGCGPKTSKGPGANDGGADGDAAGAPADGVSGSSGSDAGSGGLGGTGASGNGSSGAGPLGGVGGALPPDGDVPPAVALGKLDLLLMIDNSIGMAEKQRLLGNAVSWMLDGGTTLGTKDVHIGVITSSLGSHGAMAAQDVCVSAEDNDHAQLIGSLRPGLTTHKNSGFLAWGPDADPLVDTVLGELTPMIEAINEVGCGYEASLESWYRFLVDPEPALSVVLGPNSAQAELQGIDATILKQRNEFLRPDSVLAIVTLSDENDCSIQDGGFGWLISRSAQMFRGTSQCAANPNDKCCQSCGERTASDGCPPITTDSECIKSTMLSASGEDDLNLRCYDQKRRFGFELLYPTSRYQEALTRQSVRNRAGLPVKNPLFAGGKRHPSQVIYTGIVGVPWQDLADDASLTSTGLTYLTAAELKAKGHWDVMLGDPEASPPKRPTDPFMIETPFDRAALSSVSSHPYVKIASLVPSTSTNPQANPINGHETVNMGNRQLQTACIFPRLKPKLCDQALFQSNGSCRCFEDDRPYNEAACQPPGGGAATIMQYAEVAFPGTRHLQLQKALGDQAVTASACAKVMDEASPDFGYRPAMKALAARLQKAFKP